MEMGKLYVELLSVLDDNCSFKLNNELVLLSSYAQYEDDEIEVYMGCLRGNGTLLDNKKWCGEK